MRVFKFKVEGAGVFPMSMLASGRCWPQTPQDALKIRLSLACPPGDRVHVALASIQKPDPDEWLTINWVVFGLRSADTDDAPESRQESMRVAFDRLYGKEET